MFPLDRNFIERFAALLRGCESAYGTYDLTNPQAEHGKLKGVAKTVRAPLTLEHWKAHLEGRAAIGVILIDENNQARWGAIDVDSYGVNHGEVARRIERMGLPLIVARSKSGGMHLLLFAGEPIPAAKMIARLKAIAALLGFSGAEVFPKQPSVNWSDSDVGSWINACYFDARRTTRYAFNPADGEAMTLEEFLNRAETLRQPAQWFSEPLQSASAGGELPGAPPCLQTLVQIGIGPGQRNNTAVALGTYFKKSRPDDWQIALEKSNQTLFSPSLPSDEIVTVIRSLRRKNYGYMCKSEPLASYCDRGVCLGREHGIGGGSADVVLSHVRILGTEPPIYFVSVEGRNESLEVSLDDLWDHARFQKVCMAKLRVYPQPKKRPDWASEVTAVLQKIDTIPAPADATDTGRLRLLVEKFLIGRAQALTRDEIILGKPWRNEADRRYYFRGSDLEAYLDRNCAPVKGNKLWSILRGMGAQWHDGWKVKGTSTNLWSLPAPEVSDEPLPLPPGLGQPGQTF